MKITLIIPLSKTPVLEAIFLGIAFKEEAIKVKGAGCVFRSPANVRVDLSGIELNRVKSLVDVLMKAKAKKGHDFEIATCVRPLSEPDSVKSGEIKYESLTKRLLLSMPTGAWLISNDATWKVHLSERTDRQTAWREAVRMEVTNRKALVLWSEGDVIAYSRAISGRRFGAPAAVSGS